MDLTPLIYLAVGIGCIFIYRQLKKDGMTSKSALTRAPGRGQAFLYLCAKH